MNPTSPEPSATRHSEAAWPANTLVSCEQLAAHPDWRVFDCRHELASPEAGAAAYAESHIPGALHASLDRDLSSPPSGRNGRHPLPTLAAFTAFLGRSGLRRSDPVVCVDAGDGAFAARLWWLLRAVGHESVAVLDGGMARWRALGLPETRTVPGIEATPYPAGWLPGLQVEADEVTGNLSSRRFTVVDARAASRYAGIGDTIDPVGGHIPGALNRPFADNLDGGRFKPAARLREDWAALLSAGGDTPAATIPAVDASRIVHQCGSGVTACHNLLAMEAAGFAGSRLYPGSWSEWCSDPARPVATGATP